MAILPPPRCSIVEIGCGDITQGGAYTYKIAKTLYGQYVGVESSSKECHSAKSAGLPVVEGYFGPGLGLTQTFSAFMTFQVFEHLTDIYAVLDYALEILEPGGVGLINVPNGQQIVEENLYHQIIAEHINYFTPESLATMVKRAGFELIEIRAVSETVELDVYIRKPAPYKISMDQTRHNQQQALHAQLANSRSIGVWGAGGKAPIYGNLLSEELPITHLFDSNTEKAGKYIGSLSVPVEPVSSAALQECDTVLIFASAYNTEIIKILKETFHYPGKIVYFEDENVKQC